MKNKKKPYPEVMSPVSKEITQGYIFSCAKAEDYLGMPVNGLVITARCDIENDKAPKYNYIPIVRLQDWITRDGLNILLERAKKELIGTAKSKLQETGFSSKILESENLPKIIEKLFPENDSRRKIVKSREKLMSISEDLDFIYKTDKERDHSLVRELGNKYQKLRRKIIDELVKHSLAGYYFLPGISPDEESYLGYVVLLREIQHMPRDLAFRIKSGLSKDEYKSICTINSNLSGYLMIDDDNKSMPIGVLPSPSLEHLMQCFSNLFCRIGLPDPDPTYIESLWDNQPIFKGN